MKKSLKKILLVALLAAGSFTAFAFGKRDVTYRDLNEDAEPTENEGASMDDRTASWRAPFGEFDISEKKSGKYNIYVEAKDKGGNTEIAGPYNLYVDPDSDYPISSVTNPLQNMRIQGNLNIVGTCVDDDGVAEVWLVLDGGEPIRAEGKDFWSYYLDTNDLAEGPHTIEVWGIDINGLSSQEKPKKKAFVTWNLDRRLPVTVVTNHTLGDLVSGKINLKGTVSDGNGIKSFYYSLDNGETYVEAKIKKNKKEGNWTFDLPIDTTLSKDGPAIIWLKAIDGMGSVGISSFLYFVDNTKPDVKIVYPKPNDISNGKFTIVGYAKDKVGLQKLTWTLNGDKGEFDLTPGNPYWSLEADTIGEKSKPVDFSITAVDTAGNVVTVKETFQIDQERDKPVITVQSLRDGAVVSGKAGELFLRGFVDDDDGVAYVEVTLDGGATETIDTNGVFSTVLNTEDLSYGQHKVVIVATDIHGVKSEPTTVQFTAEGSRSTFSSAKIGGTEVFDGILVHPESNPVYEITASSPAGIASYSYKIETGFGEVYKSEDFETKGAEKNVSIKIPLSDAPWGLIQITVATTDVFDRVAEKKVLVNIKDLSYIHEDLLDAPLADKLIERDGRGAVSIRPISIGGAEYRNGMNVVIPYGASSEPVVAIFDVEGAGSPSVSYRIEGDKEIGGDEKQSGKAELVDGHYQIRLANLPSRVTNLTVEAKSGKDIGSYTVSFCVVRPAPEKVSSWGRGEIHWIPNENVVYNDTLHAYVASADTPIAGYANIPNGPVTASIMTNGLAVANDEQTLGKTIYLSGIRDGSYRGVSATIRDNNGKTYSSSALNLVIDSTPPELEVASPKNHQWVQSRVQLSANATDANGVSKVEYSLDGGENWNELSSSGNTYSANINLQNVDDGLVTIDVRATDLTGKTTLKSLAVRKDTTPPEVNVLLPNGDDIINGDNLIVFNTYDNGLLDKVQYFPPVKRGETASPVDVPAGPIVVTHVGTSDKPLDDLMAFKFKDAAGNETEIRQWDFIIDNGSDFPIAEIHVPEENAVITRDFEFSGVIYDDDGVKKDENGEVIAGPKIFYKFDDGRFVEHDQIGTSFVIPKALTDFTDNEHTITLYAVDINGCKGPEFVRNFRISLEEPKGGVLTPPISETVKGSVKMTGYATDKNGIKAVYISVDNGNTYNEAVGNYGHEMTKCDWSYEFDTRVIEDGTHVVFMKVVDWYGIEGMYSSLINIDNTPPDIDIVLPLDDSTTTGIIHFAGQTTDNINLTKLFITIRSIEGKSVSSRLSHIDLSPEQIIEQHIDIYTLDDGFYNIELTGVDAAENITRASRNIKLDKKKPKAKVDLLYPLNGEFVQGVFNIYGTAVSESDIKSLSLFVDGSNAQQTELTESGYFKFTLDQTMIEEGQHNIRVEAYLADNTKIVSNTQYLNYGAVGPWVTIDSFTYGSFAFERPYVIGNSGYSYDEDEVIRANAKGAPKELKESVEAKSVEKVEISLDNGKTFKKISKSGKWRYRIENEDIAEGYHFLLVRATMKNGETAITRCLVQVDSTKPNIKLISPGAGGRHNQTMEFSGLARDDIALKNVTLALRKGDKAWYEVPGFIKGLYFDWQFWGATLFNVGMGLTFFDDNVKLQVQWGQFTQQQRNLFDDSNLRYGGNNVWGVKLLANVYYMPFRYYFGPDWEWLSLNLALGANFTRFNESGSKKAQILSAALVQLEFPRVTFAKQKMFRTIAFYTEGQFWFIPTDVQSSGEQDIKSIVPQISFGLRVNVF